MATDSTVAPTSDSLTRGLVNLYFEFKQYLRRTTHPDGKVRQLLRLAQRTVNYVRWFPHKRLKLPLDLLTDTWEYRAALRKEWSLPRAFLRLMSMNEQLYEPCGYFDRCRGSSTVADPIQFDLPLRAAVIWNGDKIPRPTKDVSRRLLLPKLLKSSGYFRVAEAIYDKLVETPGMEAAGLAGKADIAHLFGRWQAEMSSFVEQGIHLDAFRLFEISIEKSLFGGRCDWHDIAEGYYRQAIAMDPSDPELLVGLSGLLADLHRTEEAAALLADVLEIAPGHTFAKLRFGQMKGLLGDVAEMQRQYLDASGGIPYVFEDYERHLRAEIVPLATACRARGIDFTERHRPMEVAVEYQVAYKSVVKTNRCRLAFDPGYVASFDEITDLGHGLILLDDQNPQLIGDSKHLPNANLPMFTAAIQAHTRTHAAISLPRDLETIDEGPVIVLPGFVNNYYHWVMEALGTLASLDGSSLLKTAKILVHGELKRWHRETLKLLGIDCERVIECPDAPIKVRDAICPLVLSRNTIAHPAAVEYLRKHMARPGVECRPGKRLFLTRERLRGRKVVNERIVRERLSQYGFTAVDPARMTVAQQRDFFCDAEMIVAPGGAALTNMLFCPQRTKVMAIASVHTHDETFSSLTASLGQRYWGCLSDGHPKPNPFYLWTPFDYEIDLASLERCVESMFVDV